MTRVRTRARSLQPIPHTPTAPVCPCGSAPGAAVFAVWLGLLSWAGPALADQLYVKQDKKVLRGVILEDRHDRYLMSTVDGEIEVPKASVTAIHYDDPEQSYFRLGRALQRAGRLREALQAYQKASALQPAFQHAQEAALTVQRLLWQREEASIRVEIEQKRFVMARIGAAGTAGQGAVVRPPLAEATGQGAAPFEEQFGCALGYEDGWTLVAAVQPGSTAEAAGLKPADLITAIWGEAINNLSPEAVAQQLRAVPREVLLTIEREVALAAGPGACGGEVPLEMGYDGLRVAQGRGSPPHEGGLAVGDLVIAVDGHPTRYLEVSGARQRLAAPGVHTVTVQRRISLSIQ